MKVRSAIIASMVFASTISFAGEPAVKARLTTEGFKVLSEEIVNSALPDLSEIKIPNQRGGALTVRYDLKGIKADGTIKNVKVVPMGNYLNVAVSIQDLRIAVSDVMLYERYPKPWGTDCKNLVLESGHGTPIIAELGFAAMVINNEVSFDFKKIKFKNVRQSYKVKGPETCTLPIPGGRILAAVVRKFLRRAEPLLELALKVKLIHSEPKISKALTKALNIERDFALPSMKGIPEGRVKFRAAPAGLIFDRNGVEVAYHLNLTRLNGLATENDQHAPFDSDSAAPILATVALNTSFIKQALGAVLPNGTTPIDVDNSVFPGIEDVLNKSFLASFLPDINTVTTDTDQVQLRMQILATPSVDAIAEPMSLGISANDVLLTFRISQNGQWRDYYNFKFNLAAKIAATIDHDHRLQAKLLPGTQYSYTGFWAPDYTPTDPTLDREEFGLTVDAIIDILTEQPTLFSFDLPVIPVSDGAVTLAEPTIEGNFLGVKLVKIGLPQ